jgi:hypothetical protein
MTLTPTPCDQHTQQLAEVNPIVLRPTATPMTCILAESTTRQSMPRALRKRALVYNRIDGEADDSPELKSEDRRRSQLFEVFRRPVDAMCKLQKTDSSGLGSYRAALCGFPNRADL